jgi:phosphatidylglycerophosphate synthase
MSTSTAEILVFRGGKWVPAPASELADAVRFSHIWWFYANLIDYARVAMCLLAAWTITTEWHLTSAFLIIGCTLLDWIDGPVARAYNQCSIMGSGWDWCADILCQLIQCAWWVRYDLTVFPYLFVCTSIEVTNCIFDFATTATGKYPCLAPKQRGFFWVLEFSLGENNYNSFFYTAQWLAYPIYCVGRTLEHAWMVQPGTDGFIPLLLLANRWIGFPLTFLYIWCEAAYCAHIVSSWTELPRGSATQKQAVYDDTKESALGGFTNYGLVEEEMRSLLQSSFTHLTAKMKDDYAQSLKRREIFWINIWQRSGNEPRMELPQVDKLEAWVKQTVSDIYGPNTTHLDGYGFIINPVDSKLQDWHVDYTMDYSTIFVPLSILSPMNATQYAVVPLDTPQEVVDMSIADLDHVDMDVLLTKGKGYSVRQAVAPQFSLLRMDYGTIHRGISNHGKEDRVVFWISVKKEAELLPAEPRVQIIHDKKTQ